VRPVAQPGVAGEVLAPGLRSDTVRGDRAKRRRRRSKLTACWRAVRGLPMALTQPCTAQ